MQSVKEGGFLSDKGLLADNPTPGRVCLSPGCFFDPESIAKVRKNRLWCLDFLPRLCASFVLSVVEMSFDTCIVCCAQGLRRLHDEAHNSRLG